MKPMSRWASSILVVLSGVLSSSAFAEPMSKEDYQAARNAIVAEYDGATKNCDAYSGNAKDICVAEAKARRNVAQAKLEESYSPSIKTRYAVRVAIAEGDYGVAREKCDSLSGNAKDVCLKEAKAERIRVTARAKAQMKTSAADSVAVEKSIEANATAMHKADEAHKDAAAEERDADYAVAKEKCDALAGSAKYECVQTAKAHFGRD